VLPDIRSQNRDTLAAQFAAWNQPAYRLDQLLGWLYARRAASWDEMTNLPKALRAQLASAYSLNLPQLVTKQGARDTTQKFLWRLADGALIESVLIPANPALYGEASDRHTLCISTQVGCAYGCRFCASGLDGFKRNLAPHEIIGQILAIERWATTAGPESRVQNPESAALASSRPGTRDAGPGTPGVERVVNNIVVMGMGEPMANYDNLMAALRTLNAPWGGGIGARRITISTSGLAPRIRDLANDPLQFRLAISLHGATDEVREKIMPVNRKYPLRDLAAACEYYVTNKGKMITLEYILIAGVNDSLTQTRPLAALAHQLHAKVNLIPYNKVEGLPWSRPDEEVCEAFASALENEGVTATLRREKGHDIDAACGQLRLKTEKAEMNSEDGETQSEGRKQV
jgi:23S rRNA (adenine2503-C2)-methyltransferase